MKALQSSGVLDARLNMHARDTGIPKRELRRMCFQAGLEQLKRGELKIGASTRKGGAK